MNSQTTLLHRHLDYLKLPFLKAQYAELAQQAAQQPWTHVEYLARLIDGQYQQRLQHTVQLRIQAARFPVVKTLEQFQWDWPKSINRLQVQTLFRLQFIEQNANVIFLGTVGLGKTHLATALGYAACLEGQSVLFANTIDIINNLSTAQKRNALKNELKKYLRPRVLVLDELGYLPNGISSRKQPKTSYLSMLAMVLCMFGLF